MEIELLLSHRDLGYKTENDENSNLKIVTDTEITQKDLFKTLSEKLDSLAGNLLVDRTNVENFDPSFFLEVDVEHIFVKKRSSFTKNHSARL